MRKSRLFLSLLFWAAAAGAQGASTPAGPATPPLADATPAQVRARLGEPGVASQEGKGALWTYRFEDCALMVFFKDEGRGLRVSGLSASGRRRGEAPPDVEACMAQSRG